jgi:hypothetical protein
MVGNLELAGALAHGAAMKFFVSPDDMKKDTNLQLEGLGRPWAQTVNGRRSDSYL